VLIGQVLPATCRSHEYGRHSSLYAVHKAPLGGFKENFIGGNIHEAGKHHFNHRAITCKCRTNAKSCQDCFGKGCIHDPVIAEFMHQAVPEEEYTIPFGVAEIKKEGSDITVLAISNMVQLTMEVAEKLEGKISVEVIDPRTLEPFDMETVKKSVEKTGHLVIVDEDTENCGFAAELGFRIQNQAFDDLDAPIMRVCGANYPIAGGYLEQHVLPKPEQILKAIEETLA